MEDLIQDLIKEGYLKTDRIIQAFRTVKRVHFLPDDLKEDASLNIPLPISHGQTMSQPLTVAFMLELLQPQPGNTVLDVGSGSGWQTALLAELVGKEGRVYAIERVPELKRYGQKKVEELGYKNCEFICADGTKGYKQAAPFDRIIVAAAAEIGIPDVFLMQLKIGGRLVIPVGKYEQTMILKKKISEADFKEERHPGFQFVPLVPKEWGA